jgi:hypothetical protein
MAGVSLEGYHNINRELFFLLVRISRDGCIFYLEGWHMIISWHLLSFGRDEESVTKKRTVCFDYFCSCVGGCFLRRCLLYWEAASCFYLYAAVTGVSFLVGGIFVGWNRVFICLRSTVRIVTFRFTRKGNWVSGMISFFWQIDYLSLAGWRVANWLFI